MVYFPNAAVAALDAARHFPDAATTLTAVDCLLHYSTIFKMNVEGSRCRVAAACAPRERNLPGLYALDATCAEKQAPFG